MVRYWISFTSWRWGEKLGQELMARSVVWATHDTFSYFFCILCSSKYALRKNFSGKNCSPRTTVAGCLWCI